MGVFSFWSGWFKRQDPAAGSGNVSISRERLRMDQRILADEIEQLFHRFDGRLQDLASRAHTMLEAEGEEEADDLRAAQDGLRLAVRRLQASLKATREIERELAEWERRDDGGMLHADHPEIRAEILRSELAVRGITREVPDQFVAQYIQKHADVEEGRPLETSRRMAEETIERPREYVFTTPEPVTDMETQHLLHAIRDATREAERWHALPTEYHDGDAVDQVRHLRELHAILKRLDRARGVERDRLTFAVRPRGDAS
jgi:hypothetical protein